MGLPSCFRVSGNFFFLLIERDDFKPLKFYMALCLCNQDETAEFLAQNTNHLSPLGHSAMSAVWISADPRGPLPH